MGMAKVQGGDCTVGDIISESFDPTGGDVTWTAGLVSSGCTSTLDQTAPSATGFSGQSYNTIVDADGYSEAWHYWTDGSAKSTVYIRFYVYVYSEGLSNGTAHTVFGYGTNTTYVNSLLIRVSKSSGGDLGLEMRGGGDLNIDSYPISTGTPYLVEIKAINNGTSDQFEWKINGVSQGTQSGALFDNDFQKINIGVFPDYATTAALNVSIDKLDVSSTSWLGSCD